MYELLCCKTQKRDFTRFFFLDLKIYRKVKERERQQRKEEIKTKIISKQQALLREASKHCDTRNYSSSNVIPSESSNSLDEESMVKVRIRCIPKEEDIQRRKFSKTTDRKSNEKLSQTRYNKQDAIQVAEFDGIYCKQNYSNTKSYPVSTGLKGDSKQDISKCLIKSNHLVE